MPPHDRGRTEAELARRLPKDLNSDDTTHYMRHALALIVQFDVAAHRPVVALLVKTRQTDAPDVYLRRICAQARVFDHPLGDSEAWAAFVQEELQQVYNYSQRRR